MSNSNVALKSYGVEDFLSAESRDCADKTVIEVFGVMFGFDAKSIQTSTPNPNDLNERTAIVGFSGAMRGSCQIRMSSDGARSITSAMLGGAPVDENDESIDDAVGELCNMLAGGWKNHISALSSECALSPPSVISGRHYKVHLSKPSVSITRIYQFDAHELHLTLHREDISPHQP
jgi:chemotaxis protein CheX